MSAQIICYSMRKDWEVARKKKEKIVSFPKDEMRQKNYSYYLVFQILRSWLPLLRKSGKTIILG